MKYFSKLYVIERAPGGSRKDMWPVVLVVLGLVVLLATFAVGVMG